jgi:hypothetical protein
MSYNTIIVVGIILSVVIGLTVITFKCICGTYKAAFYFLWPIIAAAVVLVLFLIFCLWVIDVVVTTTMTVLYVG